MTDPTPSSSSKAGQLTFGKRVFRNHIITSLYHTYIQKHIDDVMFRYPGLRRYLPNYVGSYNKGRYLELSESIFSRKWYSHEVSGFSHLHILYYDTYM